MRCKYLWIVLLVPFFSLAAQTTKEDVMKNILQAGGTYYSYPTPTGKLSPAPKGYKPFYISHYGRHGSRYMTTNKNYTYVINALEKADSCRSLTAYGQDVLKRLKVAYADAYLRDGDLSKLGAMQHRGIATRMYRNFPEVFQSGTSVDAKSSVITRCAISMANFCNALQGINPKLNISMETSQRNMWYIANGEDSIPNNAGDTILKKQLRDFTKKMFKPARLVSTLFTDQEYIKKNVEGERLVDKLYNVAEDMQCQPQLKLSFFDLFTDEELFDIWQTDNAGWCLWKGFMPGSAPRYKAYYGLLRNILDNADTAIRQGGTAVTLRFGHDSILAPLAYLLHLKGCDNFTADWDNLYKHWSDFKVVPMAGNIQLVFYRKTGSDDILVKFLLHEKETSIPVKTDIAPYYHWKDVEAFYRAELTK
ncbi:MAG: histidine phosphatase family protein [Bacteroidales bacterium]|nr:histidine phosphatase family protein [Bacteroidales bacterium]